MKFLNTYEHMKVFPPPVAREEEKPSYVLRHKAQFALPCIVSNADFLVQTAVFDGSFLSLITKNPIRVKFTRRQTKQISPKSPSDGVRGWDGGAYGGPWPRSDGYAHG